MRIEIRADGAHIFGYVNVTEKKSRPVVTPHVNIPAWQEAGYQGDGLTIFHDDVEKTHSECCTDIISTILPKSRVLSGSISYETEQDAVTKCSVFCRETGETLPVTEFVEKYDVSQINNSKSGKASNDLNTPIAVYMREMIRKYNLFCTGSAGNHDSKNNRYKGAFALQIRKNNYAGGNLSIFC